MDFLTLAEEDCYRYRLMDLLREIYQVSQVDMLRCAEVLAAQSQICLMGICATYKLSQAGDRQALIWRIVAKFSPAQHRAAPVLVEQLSMEALIAL